MDEEQIKIETSLDNTELPAEIKSLPDSLYVFSKDRKYYDQLFSRYKHLMHEDFKEIVKDGIFFLHPQMSDTYQSKIGQFIIFLEEIDIINSGGLESKHTKLIDKLSEVFFDKENKLCLSKHEKKACQSICIILLQENFKALKEKSKATKPLRAASIHGTNDISKSQKKKRLHDPADKKSKKHRG
jgi:hypothetical protein